MPGLRWRPQSKERPAGRKLSRAVNRGRTSVSAPAPSSQPARQRRCLPDRLAPVGTTSAQLRHPVFASCLAPVSRVRDGWRPDSAVKLEIPWSSAYGLEWSSVRPGITSAPIPGARRPIGAFAEAAAPRSEAPVPAATATETPRFGQSARRCTLAPRPLRRRTPASHCRR